MNAVPPGTPTWVDLSTTDLADATRFYRELFGWTAHVAPQPEAGGYTMFHKDGQVVAGAGPVPEPDRQPGWSTYVATDDADAVATRVEAAGGAVLVTPFDVMDQGRMGVFTDNTGATFSVWQPLAMTGAELFNAPGALCWNELTTRDPDPAKAFYGTVFNWTPKDQPMGDLTYTVFHLDDHPVAGMMPMVGEAWPADLPAHWMVYFAVGDTDANAGRAAALGGTVSVPPTDLPQGRFAVLTDPQGAVFSIITMNE